jgi:uncharacterized protein GlcG (DUF336 family)
MRATLISALAGVALALSACSGDGLDDGGCDGGCVDSNTVLSTGDVNNVLARAVREAEARDADATIAVVDRVGNVLGVYRMPGADTGITITSPDPVEGGLEDLSFIPDSLAAISKAITGAYLSSEGNAFSTRTAGQIVQEHFNPGEVGQPSGPLFGVQFSQLACSDLTRTISDAKRGPKRAPLGLAADPGGFPLYQDGTVVGGVGVIADGRYSFDANLGDDGFSLDEVIARAATQAFPAPANRQAERITLQGKVFRYADMEPGETRTGGAPPALGALPGNLIAVNGYFSPPVKAGTVFGQPASGIRADNSFFPDRDAFVLVDGNNNNRYPPRASPTGGLTQNEVQTILDQALGVAASARAQIRRPLGTNARVTISVVDDNGVPLGVVRGEDAPVFGTDVSLQKARTAAFFSSTRAAADLQSGLTANYLASTLSGGAPVVERTIRIGDYVTALRDFLGDNTALANGMAFSDRAGGNLSRPFFPDGLTSAPHGPLSKPRGEWSPFSTGLQLDLSYDKLVGHVAFVAGLGPSPGTGCSNISRSTGAGPVDPLANGSQIFPGSVPIYKGDTLVGGIGVSGDGVDQDDLIAFLGVHRAGRQLGTVNNAPRGMRADRIVVDGTRLRYVQCPFKPFTDSDAHNVCEGK